MIHSTPRARAVFLDRDGTLVHPRHYPSHPRELVLFDGIEIGLRLLQTAGLRLIVVTNQPGLAHGHFGEGELQTMHQHLIDELARLDVRLDGIYYCPHHPEGCVIEWTKRCDCRKPQPGLLRRAAAEHNLELWGSWFVGDILDDVEAGNRVGCNTVLVDLGTESCPRTALRRPDFVAFDTRHALSIVAAVEGLGPPVEMDYAPPRWNYYKPKSHPAPQYHIPTELP